MYHATCALHEFYCSLTCMKTILCNSLRHLKKRDFETYQKRFRDFEILLLILATRLDADRMNEISFWIAF